jgi:YVTN family beta-propeller protein
MPLRDFKHRVLKRAVPVAAPSSARFAITVLACALAAVLLGPQARADRPTTPVYRSPQAVCVSPDGTVAYVVNATSNTVSVVNLAERKVLGEIDVGLRPCHAVLTRDGSTLYVSCSWDGLIDVVDTAARRAKRSLPGGFEPNGLALSPDEKFLYVTNVVTDSVFVVDVASAEIDFNTSVGHQPRYVAPIAGTTRAVVANGLGRGVTILDGKSGEILENRPLGRASLLRQIVCSSDGHWAFAANLVSHDEAPTLQIERGWIHSNGFTIMDLTRPGHRVTLLLDQLIRGAANPTGVALSSDNRRLYVSLAGIHEIAFIDVPAALALAAEAETHERIRQLEEDVEIVGRLRIARRVPSGGLGPRAIALNEAKGELVVAHYFSDTLTILDANTGALRAEIPLGPPQELSLWRKGELLSCDARICYQNWYSCVSCHQEDGTDDGLNWDLANDGLGNPKNAKDLLNAHDTSPAMWGGVRADLNDGVAGGQRFLGFVADAERQKALMEYFGKPEYAPNPFRGKSPTAEKRGEHFYVATGCSICHPAPLYTDLKLHDLGMKMPDDYRSRFDTPSLRGVYRTGPWLHDGRAPTLRSIFSEHNPRDVHGRTQGLSEQELDDLVTYLRTL